jgi:hypothetical protein
MCPLSEERASSLLELKQLPASSALKELWYKIFLPAQNEGEVKPPNNYLGLDILSI